MNLSPDTRYAVRILFELEKINSPLSINSLALQTGIAQRTVEKIHTILKKNSITVSILGAKGGIALNIPLNEISLGQLVKIFDQGVLFAVCYGNKANECPQQYCCEISKVWYEISKDIQNKLDSVYLDTILSGYSKDCCVFNKNKTN